MASAFSIFVVFLALFCLWCLLCVSRMCVQDQLLILIYLSLFVGSVVLFIASFSLVAFSDGWRLDKIVLVGSPLKECQEGGGQGSYYRGLMQPCALGRERGES